MAGCATSRMRDRGFVFGGAMSDQIVRRRRGVTKKVPLKIYIFILLIFFSVTAVGIIIWKELRVVSKTEAESKFEEPPKDGFTFIRNRELIEKSDIRYDATMETSLTLEDGSRVVWGGEYFLVFYLTKPLSTEIQKRIKNRILPEEVSSRVLGVVEVKSDTYRIAVRKVQAGRDLPIERQIFPWKPIADKILQILKEEFAAK